MQTPTLHADILEYNGKRPPEYQEICNRLSALIMSGLPQAENKVWHGHPVWFIDGNPIVGYSMQKRGVRLMFWSGADFDEPDLNVRGEKFKDASIFYNSEHEVNVANVRRWLATSVIVQYDYKNLVKRKGVLTRL